MSRPIDETDVQLITALRRDPRATVTELARRLDLARGTVYSRLERLERTGVITGYGPDVDASKAGLGVLAFTTLSISQGAHTETTARLAEIPEILEIHTVTGGGDLLCRIVAGSNDHLHDVLQQIAALPSVRRSESQLALSTSVQRTAADLLARR